MDPIPTFPPLVKEIFEGFKNGKLVYAQFKFRSNWFVVQPFVGDLLKLAVGKKDLRLVVWILEGKLTIFAL